MLFRSLFYPALRAGGPLAFRFALALTIGLLAFLLIDMLEADLLCERVCLIDKGTVVVTGTPTEVKQRFSKTRVIEVTTRDLAPPLEQLRQISGVARVESRMDGPLQKITLHVEKGSRVHFDLVECLGEETIESMTERDPNLEEDRKSVV